jgi:hypothetical protein
MLSSVANQLASGSNSDSSNGVGRPVDPKRLEMLRNDESEKGSACVPLNSSDKVIRSDEESQWDGSPIAEKEKRPVAVNPKV